MDYATYRKRRADGYTKPRDLAREKTYRPNPPIDWHGTNDGGAKATVIVNGAEIKLRVKPDNEVSARDQMEGLGEVKWISTGWSRPDCSEYGDTTGYVRRHDGEYCVNGWYRNRDHPHIVLEETEDAIYKHLRSQKYGKAQARDAARKQCAAQVDSAVKYLNGDYSIYGVIASWEDEQSSCWGIEADGPDDAYITEIAWDQAYDVAPEATPAWVGEAIVA